MEHATQSGGSFFLEDIAPEDVFTPEDFGEHHVMLARTTERFVKNEVAPWQNDFLGGSQWILN